jgi:hypothetical protein
MSGRIKRHFFTRPSGEGRLYLANRAQVLGGEVTLEAAPARGNAAAARPRGPEPAPRRTVAEVDNPGGVRDDRREAEGCARSSKSPNEGEGNRTAARQYNEATREFVKSGKVDQQAEPARRAVEGSERAELEKAEKAGRDRMKEERPRRPSR